MLFQMHIPLFRKALPSRSASFMIFLPFLFLFLSSLRLKAELSVSCHRATARLRRQQRSSCFLTRKVFGILTRKNTWLNIFIFPGCYSQNSEHIFKCRKTILLYWYFYYCIIHRFNVFIIMLYAIYWFYISL